MRRAVRVARGAGVQLPSNKFVTAVFKGEGPARRLVALAMAGLEWQPDSPVAAARFLDGGAWRTDLPADTSLVFTSRTPWMRGLFDLVLVSEDGAIRVRVGGAGAEGARTQWEAEDGRFLRLQPPTPLAVPVPEGHAEFFLSGGLSYLASKDRLTIAADTPDEAPPAGATPALATLKVDPAVERDGIVVAASLVSNASRLIEVDWNPAPETPILWLGADEISCALTAPDIVAGGVQPATARVAGATLPLLALGTAHGDALLSEPLQPAFPGGGAPVARVSDADGTLTITDVPCNLLGLAGAQEDATLAFDRRLLLVGGGIKAVTEGARFLCRREAAPLTVEIPAGTSIELTVAPGAPRLTVAGTDGGPAATVYVPGFATDTPPSDRQRFVFDVVAQPESGHALAIGPDGLEVSAVSRPTRIGLGELDEVEVLEGRLSVRGPLWHVEASATAALPYFNGAQGSVSLRGTGGTGGEPRLDVTFEQSLADWEDPSGLLRVQNPGAAITVTWNQASPATPWTIDGRLRGTLVLQTSRFASGAASAWLTQLFSGVRLHFDALSLAELSKPAISINVQGGTLDVGLWEIFTARIEGLKLGRGFVQLSMRCLATLPGGGLFEARLPELKIDLGDAGVDLAGPLRLDGQLALPQGIRARVYLEYEKTRDREVIGGGGALTIAGLVPITVTARLGRRFANDRWHPLFFLYASADIQTPVFPGVFLRDTGAGFGINQVLKGVGASRTALRKVVTEGPLPDPALPESWVDGIDEGHDAQVTSFVASSWIAPARTGSDVPFPYVARLTLYLEIGDELVLMAFGQLWIMTSLEDAKGKVAQNPSARGALALYTRQPRLEGYLVLDPEGRMGTPIEPVASALRAVNGEASILATPDLFRLRIGPLRVQAQALGILAVEGSCTYVVEVRQGRPVMLLHAALAARYEYNASAGLGLGPLSLTLSAHVRAGFAIETTYVGGVLPSNTLAVYARARLEAYASLALSLHIVFSLRLEFGWGWAKVSIHIHWEKLLQVSLGLYVSAQVEAIASTSGLAFDGQATVTVQMCGYSFDVQLSFKAGDLGLLGQAREFQQLLTA